MPVKNRDALDFGRGVDRAIGVVLAEPTDMDDLRNIHFRPGGVISRRGSPLSNALGEGVDPPVDIDVVAIIAVRGFGKALILAYVDDNGGSDPGGVCAWTVDYDGGNILPAGAVTWPFLAMMEEPPVSADEDEMDKPMLVMAADSLDRLMVAHDQARYWNEAETAELRAVTFIYEMKTNSRGDLTADLDGSGAEPVRFRGVARYLNYMLGWGYGTDTDPNRPEILRISIAGSFDVFKAEHYFIVGQRDEHVMNCMPAGTERAGVCVILKEFELYALIGYERASFNVRLIDDKYGVIAPRLAISIGGRVYFWSQEGPRYTDGGPSVDMAMPLDLRRPAPQGLAPEGEAREAFAFYRPHQEEIEFCFGRRSYVWDVRRQLWSYRDYGAPLLCAGILYPGSEPEIEEQPPTEPPDPEPPALALPGYYHTAEAGHPGAINWGGTYRGDWAYWQSYGKGDIVNVITLGVPKGLYICENTVGASGIAPDVDLGNWDVYAGTPQEKLDIYLNTNTLYDSLRILGFPVPLLPGLIEQHARTEASPTDVYYGGQIPTTYAWNASQVQINPVLLNGIRTLLEVFNPHTVAGVPVRQFRSRNYYDWPLRTWDTVAHVSSYEYCALGFCWRYEDGADKVVEFSFASMTCLSIFGAPGIPTSPIRLYKSLDGGTVWTFHDFAWPLNWPKRHRYVLSPADIAAPSIMFKGTFNGGESLPITVPATTLLKPTGFGAVATANPNEYTFSWTPHTASGEIEIWYRESLDVADAYTWRLAYLGAYNTSPQVLALTGVNPADLNWHVRIRAVSAGTAKTFGGYTQITVAKH